MCSRGPRRPCREAESPSSGRPWTSENGHEVPADWYFPEATPGKEAPPPERIIYLQHGFLARGVFYDYTASYLAKQTNSIVVAPTLTSNIFATDGMWLGGDQMHRAVADLFLDDNDALLEERTSSRLQSRTNCRSKSSSSGIRSAAAW